MKEQMQQNATPEKRKKAVRASLQELYNRRRELQRAVKDVERLIEEEKNRLKATSAQN